MKLHLSPKGKNVGCRYEQINQDEISEAFSMNEEKWEMLSKFQWEHLKGKDNLRVTDVDSRIILQCIQNK